MSHAASINFRPIIVRTALGAAALLVIAIFIWQGVTASGNPNPLTVDAKASPAVAILDIGVLVFREGLECILVLSAITGLIFCPDFALRGEREFTSRRWPAFVVPGGALNSITEDQHYV